VVLLLKSNALTAYHLSLKTTTVDFHRYLFDQESAIRLENFSYGKTHNTAWTAARSSRSMVGGTVEPWKLEEPAILYLEQKAFGNSKCGKTVHE